jgi:CubicO group peptidase (beta-lactamase class C family)
MSESNTSVGDFQLGGDVAAPHSEVEGKLQPIPAAQIDNTLRAGAINSSASDMAKWMIVQLGSGQIPGAQKRLFSRKVVG